MKTTVFHILLIAVIGSIVYSNTFDAPFHFDDYANIVENPAIKGFTNLPPRRCAGVFTFSLNYRLHGLDPWGYHAFNLFVHLLSATLVYFLVGLIAKGKRDAALFSALLFAAHPVQTQAVTYIVQRFTSLSAAFCLMSFVLYIKWRRAASPWAVSLYALSLLSALLAMKTKETALVLPFLMALYEMLFHRGERGRRFFHLLPFFLVMLTVPLGFDIFGGWGEDKPSGSLAGHANVAARVQTAMPRLDYLLTELRVMATYVRLIFFPINQNLDYDYPVFRSFFVPDVWLSALFLASLLALSVYLLSRRGAVEYKIAGFGIMWFFVALLPESSVIPIEDVIAEHRLYLPSVGMFMAAAAVFTMPGRLRALRIAALVVAVTMFSYAAYERNSVWGGRMSLWSDVVEKSPLKARGYNNLGLAYMDEGRPDKAIEHFAAALRLRPEFAEAHNNIGYAYLSKGQPDRAIAHFISSLELESFSPKVHNNLGVAYGMKDMKEKAVEHFEEALRLRPDFEEARFNLDAALRGAKDYRR